MRLALVNGVRAEPKPGTRGECCSCGNEMIAKCSQSVRWHWAHKGRRTCDPWQESETEWHCRWKNAFPLECQEVVHVDSQTQKQHIADVKTQTGFVVEIQHSPISTAEVQSRENFYQDMIWLVDARDLAGDFALGTTSSLVCCSPLLYGIVWSGRSKLLEKWSESGVPVFFDTSSSTSEIDVDIGRLWLPRSNLSVPVQERVLWRLYEYDVESRQGLIAPINSEILIAAVMNGDYPPFCVCEEEDAWLFRRRMIELAGQIDESGNRIPFLHSSRGTPPVQSPRGSSQAVVDDADLPF